jgi:hypothetical protein
LHGLIYIDVRFVAITARQPAGGAVAMTIRITSIYFQPPLAIARLGGSDKPLDCFVWDSDRSIHGGSRTVIRPTTSLRVVADGSLRPYLPNAIQFRDGDLLRPVAPFFELWATVSDLEGTPLPDTALNLETLADAGVSQDSILDSVEYTITVANRKAARRTQKASCAYIAEEKALGSDHERKALLAYSPHNPGEEPLVARDRPIPLGHFQVIKPIAQIAMGVDLSTLRVRFTPATGEVYGPDSAIAGPASPLPPGEALPKDTLGGRLHDIVPERNRILNPHTPWSRYVMDAADQQDPQPSDSYDGANVGGNRSWGVVDDSCDGVIEARVVIKGERFVARARVLSSCPDFAPDRRPFNSLADDLADRDMEPVQVTGGTKQQTEREIVDLFQRAYETASLINLDAIRTRGIIENIGEVGRKYPNPPHINYASMTAGDKVPDKPYYSSMTAQLFEEPPAPNAPAQPPIHPNVDPVPYSTTARFVHGPLCDIDALLDALALDYDRIKRLIRPPFGRLRNLASPRASVHEFRDPRKERDGLHDMRMPPYMRDSDQNSLSITFRQYNALLALMGLEKSGRQGLLGDTPSKRRIVEFTTWRWRNPDTPEKPKGKKK